MTSTRKEREDLLDPARAAALWAALGHRPAPSDIAPGAPLPPFFHQIYFWEAEPPAGLGRDGHPLPGGPIRKTGLPRRMWAGGRLEFLHPVRLGRQARKVSVPGPVQRKTGKSGPLAFVTLRHEIWQDDRLCVTEEQDLVYRSDPEPGAAPPTPPQAPPSAGGEAVTFDPTLLFRYSALTFNGHRIHYDLDYCRDVEGYPGLVVHGPLLAQLLMLRADRALGGIRRFDFRATAPLCHGEAAQLCQDADRYWVAGPEGRLCLTATAA